MPSDTVDLLSAIEPDWAEAYMRYNRTLSTPGTHTVYAYLVVLNAYPFPGTWSVCIVTINESVTWHLPPHLDKLQHGLASHTGSQSCLSCASHAAHVADLQITQSTYSRSAWVHAYATDLHIDVNTIFMNSELLVHLRTSINLTMHDADNHPSHTYKLCHAYHPCVLHSTHVIHETNVVHTQPSYTC